ncbi:glycoside hydrolase family 47 protein [Collybiopsis luxurians FD-317 M1]|uniref:alpha-1,2-Mannosidase n=1 Tax=Collybiopsis luxurians FD-317 M1 TaxID=944289 RepID=A0A0D0CIF9_9AGAR|nr:glycoside hydrolase family 47 protein [Collybiopsis luxurians FD-317 M1]
MVDLSLASKLILLVGFSNSFSVAGPVQVPGLSVPPAYAQNQAAVKEIVLQSYNAYTKFAFGHDSLAPVSGGVIDDRNGWGASIVDALGTLFLMNLTDQFEQALNFTSQIDFSNSNTDSSVSLFETTIRYVGGMISAYELSGKQHNFLIQQAKVLADKMAFAWAEPGQTIPYGEIFFDDNSPIFAINNVAEAGTLDVEWSRLSLYTGNQTYTSLTEGSVRTIANQPDPSGFPGFAPQLIDPSDNEFVDAFLTWGGGTDSYLEYLIKYARVTNTNDTLFADTWHAAVDSSIRNLLTTSTVGNHTYLADWDSGEVLLEGSHLACFAPGNWILGGKLLNNDTIVNIGLQLADACWNTYASTATGIGPESFAFIAPIGTFQQPTRQEQTFYNEHGFFITNGVYIQRPEVLESNFYAWRVTGDTKYLDRAASAIKSFQTFLVANETNGYAGINDVTNPPDGLQDDTESFWFAEVLKYLWLTFDDPDNISLDNFVFNTEGQVFEAPPALPVYGSGAPRAASGNFRSKTATGPLPLISPGALGSIQAGPLSHQ